MSDASRVQQTIMSRRVKLDVPEEMLRQLEALAVLDNVTIDDVVAAAASSYIHNRRSAPGFGEELAAARAKIAAEVQRSAPAGE